MGGKKRNKEEGWEGKEGNRKENNHDDEEREGMGVELGIRKRTKGE